MPTFSCQDNNAFLGQCLSGVWSADPGLRPRSLNECRHLPGTDPVCGETPEWFYSETEPSEDGQGQLPHRLRHQQRDAWFQVIARLYGVRCFEETGWDRLGSDELRVAMSAWRFNGNAGQAEGFQAKWDGGGFDSTGNRAVLPRLLAPPEVLAFTSSVGLNQTVAYTMNLFERDCDDGDVLCRGLWIGTGVLIAAGVVWAVAALCPPCAAALLTAEGIGITALAASAYVALLLEGSRHDALGGTSWFGSPALFGERFTATHLPGFMNQPEGAIPGPLPRLRLGTDRGASSGVLALPNVELSGRFDVRNFNPAETDSPTQVLIGFREWRGAAASGSNYLTQFLLQRVRCSSRQECETPPSTDPTQP